MLTHFANKAWLVTFEHRTGGFGCYDYGVCGIFNKKNLAEIALDKLKKQNNNNNRKEFKIQEINLDGEHVLFNFVY